MLSTTSIVEIIAYLKNIDLTIREVSNIEYLSILRV